MGVFAVRPQESLNVIVGVWDARNRPIVFNTEEKHSTICVSKGNKNLCNISTYAFRVSLCRTRTSLDRAFEFSKMTLADADGYLDPLFRG